MLSSNHEDRGDVDKYAAYCLDEFIRKESSSGGIFTILARKVLENGGCVYGAAFDQNFLVKHVCVESIEELSKLRGSKYVQSDMNGCIRLVKQQLMNGRKVLFSGCPCQVNGLINSIDNKWRKNLLTVDFVCHGVPSPQIWSKYIDLQRKKIKIINNISFRDKKYGWKTFSLRFGNQMGENMSNILTHDKYMQMFLRNVILRPSCYKCTLPHFSDITLADYWEISKENPEMNDDKGISMVLVNTDKGKLFWDNIKDNIRYVSKGKIKPKTQKVRLVPQNRKALFEDASKLSFDVLYSKHVKRGFLFEFGNLVKGYTKIALHHLHLYNWG